MNIREYSVCELKDLVGKYGEKAYRANQIYDWLHKHMISSLDEALNIGKELKERINSEIDVSFPTIEAEYISKLDDTKKYLIKLSDGNLIESVLMKYKYGYTLCVSSEVGCNMGCKFCASTIGGLKRRLTATEMLAQVYLISKCNNIRISNLVIMGMGEPLDNFENLIRFISIIGNENGQNISLRNITVSTCGLVENIYKLAKLKLPITLALSLHAPTDAIRKKIMPISKKYKVDEVISAMTEYFICTGRRITFEYSLIDGLNSSVNDAYDLVRLFRSSFINKHIDFNVNLIAVNEISESRFVAPDKVRVKEFAKVLSDNGINVTIRRELGRDISGSCGQLRARQRN